MLRNRADQSSRKTSGWPIPDFRVHCDLRAGKVAVFVKRLYLSEHCGGKLVGFAVRLQECEPIGA